ncbi:hypothetical protein U2F10_03175 [Leptothoe sp. EHU-05/26/07-4]
MKLVIIDTSCILHQISHLLVTFGDNHESIYEYAYLALQWIDTLAFCPQWSAQRYDFKVLWACDRKPYWRSDFEPEYKGHRGPPPFALEYVKRAFEDLRREGKLIAMSLVGQEADDVAASVIRLRNQLPFDQYFLFTVDSDWQGLIVDTRITWCDTVGHEPRVRTRHEAYSWLMSKHKKQSVRDQLLWPLPEQEEFVPEDIWNWKSAVGDAADNLPAGTPPYLINLFHPPHEYDPVVRHRESIMATISRLSRHTPTPPTDLEVTLHCYGVGLPLSVLSLSPGQVTRRPGSSNQNHHQPLPAAAVSKELMVN